MRGTSGRDAKICRPLSRSTASAPDPPPAGAHLRGERRAGRARARGARGGGQEERGRGEQHGDEAERPSHRAVESRQPAGRGEVAVAFRLPSRDSRRDGQTAGPAPLARRDVRAARARAGARGADSGCPASSVHPAAGLCDPRRRRRTATGDAAVAWAGTRAATVLAAYRPRGGPWGAGGRARSREHAASTVRSSRPCAERRVRRRLGRRQLVKATCCARQPARATGTGLPRLCRTAASAKVCWRWRAPRTAA